LRGREEKAEHPHDPLYAHRARSLAADDIFRSDTPKKSTLRLVVATLTSPLIGKKPLWKQEVEMGKRNNQSFVRIPHTRFIEMVQYKAALVGIQVKITEEAYTSKASFLDLDPIPSYDPNRTELPKFSGRRVSRGMYQTSSKRLINADVNGSFNIGRKVFPTAFGLGIAASAVRPRRLAV
jgi:putative transposase